MQKLITLVAFLATSSSGQGLPAMNVNPNTITVSGHSSGAFMGTTAHVTFSNTFKGGSFHNGGIYGTGDHFDPLFIGVKKTFDWGLGERMLK